mmetsp:Transcript_10395/g.15959  ORF Transcript_10395/g.15959 Transcript_10395/m.15959 type:complete len:129 (+) Transcript_10395:114-500(+)
MLLDHQVNRLYLQRCHLCHRHQVLLHRFDYFLEEVSPMSGEAFDDATSPQFKALKWLETYHTKTCIMTSLMIESSRDLYWIHFIIARKKRQMVVVVVVVVANDDSKIVVAIFWGPITTMEVGPCTPLQ